MWKIFAAFIVFALAALFVIMKGGDKVDMQGEAGHGTPSSSASHDASTPAVTPPAAAPTAPAAPAASAPESSTPPASGAAPAASK
jgi:hypothetical protein